MRHSAMVATAAAMAPTTLPAATMRHEHRIQIVAIDNLWCWLFTRDKIEPGQSSRHEQRSADFVAKRFDCFAAHTLLDEACRPANDRNILAPGGQNRKKRCLVS